MTASMEPRLNSAFAALPTELEEQKQCDCVYHRYHVAHICGCGALLTHSQSDWDAHRFHEMISFDSGFVHHSDTAKQVFDRLVFYGVPMYEQTAWEAVYDYASNNW